MAAQIVSRGYVVVYTPFAGGNKKVTAVVSGPMAESLKKKVGGKIVSAKGLTFRYAQSRQVRVLVNPEEVM